MTANLPQCGVSRVRRNKPWRAMREARSRPVGPPRGHYCVATIVHIPDMSAIYLRIQRNTARDPLSWPEVGGARTRFSCRYEKTAPCLAILVSSAERCRPFSDKQIALLENFAAQAVIAMENARLLHEIARSARKELRMHRSRTWATALPCSTKRSIWSHGTSKFQEILDVPDEIIARAADVPGICPIPG